MPAVVVANSLSLGVVGRGIDSQIKGIYIRAARTRLCVVECVDT